MNHFAFFASTASLVTLLGFTACETLNTPVGETVKRKSSTQAPAPLSKSPTPTTDFSPQAPPPAVMRPAPPARPSLPELPARQDSSDTKINGWRVSNPTQSLPSEADLLTPSR